MSIQDLHQLLDEASFKLRSATLSDPFISQADLKALLEGSEGSERQLLEALYQLARAIEPETGGRITRSDIDRAAVYIREQLLPQLALPAEPLSTDEQARLAPFGKAAVGFARAWKSYALDRPSQSAESIVSSLRPLLEGLHYNSFYQDQADIQAYWVQRPLSELSEETFLSALYRSQERELFDILNYLENPRTVTPVDQFLFNFLDVQADDRIEQAYQVIELLLQQLHDLRQFRFDSNHFETTTWIIAGLSRDQQLVFLMQRVFWT